MIKTHNYSIEKAEPAIEYLPAFKRFGAPFWLFSTIIS